MKPVVSLLLIAFSLTGTSAPAQLKYRDVSDMPLYGKAGGTAENTAWDRYARFPDSLRDISREALWRLSGNSAGMAIRFSSDSPVIAAKWTNRDAYSMNHMTDTAVRGLDLYMLVDGQWRFVNSARPADGKENQAVMVENMSAAEREYMLYLSLYDGITALEIGVDSLSSVCLPKIESPRRSKPVVFYGTSILQGGCASRPGMAFTNIISRRLDVETINLGFSGNAFLDFEVAELMAEVDAGCYILDFVPNASVEQILEKAKHFYGIIRGKHPRTPIIFVEDPVFPLSAYDRRLAREVADKNEALRFVFNELTSGGESDICLIRSDGMLGDDGEATVDGIHFTDIGMVRYSDLVCPVIDGFLAGL